jgi:hypothetical protein
MWVLAGYQAGLFDSQSFRNLKTRCAIVAHFGFNKFFVNIRRFSGKINTGG